MNNILNKLINETKPFKSAIFTVFITIIAAVSVSFITSLGKQIIKNELDSAGMNALSASAYKANGENATGNELYKSILEMPDTKNATPIVCDTAKVSFSTGKSADVMMWGINDNASSIVSLNVAAGRMINEGDIQSSSHVCLIDKNLAERIYKRTNINNKKITVYIGNKTAVLNIIGTIEKESNVLNALIGNVVPDFIYVPYTTMLSLSDKSGFDQIVFTSENMLQSSKELKQRLVKEDYKYYNQKISLTNLSAQKKQIEKISDTAFIALFMVSCVAVLVCSMSVGASVNTAVISKQKDIGIKMSLGANRRDITTEFMIAAILSCLAGIILALFTMIPIVIFIKYAMPIKFKIDIFLIALSIFATIILTAVFSFTPSYAASKISPIKALKRE